MFIDTSVFVAIFAHEDDASRWLEKIAETPGKTTSPLVMLEAVMRLSSILKVPPADILARFEAFMQDAEIGVIPMEIEHGRLAIEAFARYGKGRGHPAQLNLADCLSYACASVQAVPLLYKGEDFSKTDLA